MRGLQWGDIEGGILTIQHNYQNKEGLKLPKYNSVRKVPIPAAVQELLDTAWKFACKLAPDIGPDVVIEPSPNTFVLESDYFPGKPLGNNFYREAVDKELSAIGISLEQQKERNLSPHSLRHSFVTLGRLSGISDPEIQALAGHKPSGIMGKYSHIPQVINFAEAKRKLEVSYTVKHEEKAENG
jgi:integrase